MKIKTKCLLTLLVLISTLQLAGCVTAGKKALPKGGVMTMAAIYKQETGLSLRNNGTGYVSDLKAARQRVRIQPRTRYVGHLAHSNRKVSGMFKRLSNPAIPIYIYPHLVHADGGAHPVPGYTTAFFLYKQDHFALPSENY